MRTIESINRCCEAIEQRESEVHAFVEDSLNVDRIIDQAADLLRDFPDAADRPPLFGTLVGIKDIVHVDGYPTACGSRLPAAELTGPEAALVTRLKQAGIVVAGKTVTTEFAHTDPGPTRNPLNLEHTPGGSSSGSAAGVAAGFFDLALGSQTGGSTIRPAAYCGIVGFKPSFGRVNIEGFYPYSKSMDHVGLFARDIELIETAMSVSADDWRGEAICAEPRFAVPDGPYLDLAGEAARQQFVDLIEFLRQFGLRVDSHGVLDDIDRQNQDLVRLTDAEAYRVHADMLARYADRYGPLFLEAMEAVREVTDTELEALRAAAKHKQEEMRHCMQDREVDFWLAPAATEVAPLGLESTGDYRMNAIWTYTGLPAITLPSGLNHAGLPYGLQIVGRFGQDEELIATAKSLQRLLPQQDEPSPGETGA